MAKLILFKEVTGELSWVECKNLDDYYKHLDCRCFDVVNSEIDGLDVYVDDEGLLTHKHVSALDVGLQPWLVGNLIFARHNREGETVSCKEADMEKILNRVVSVFNADNGKQFKVVWLGE